MNLNIIKDYDLKKSIHLLIAESSKLKAEIFRVVILGKDLEEKNIDVFESHMNEFLRFWTDHAESLQSAIRGATGAEANNIKTLEYDYVKNYIFGRYDYASVLQFTDGVLRDIENGKMEDPEDIEDFKNHTISLAFNKQDPTVAGLLDSVLMEEIGQYHLREISALDIKMFDSVRNYDELFNRRNRPELHKAIMKVIEYITTKGTIECDPHYQDRTLYITLVNNIVEYITYSLTAYATRIFIISQYITPFLPDSNNSEVISESVGMDNVSLSNISENPNGSISSVLHNTDELIIKDPKRSKEFFDRFGEFMKLIGADSQFNEMPTYETRYFQSNLLKGNKMDEKLKDNPLYKFISTSNFIGFGSYTTEQIILEFHHNLKSFLYNKYQGLQGPTTLRHEFLHVIRGTEYGESVKDYQKLAADLYLISLMFNRNVTEYIDNSNRGIGNELETNRLPIVCQKLLGECVKFLIDWYEEMMFVFAQKAGFIERRINELRSGEIKKVIDNTSITIPDWKSDINLNNHMMLSVPDTARIPYDHKDLYALPAFESFEMQDEYLRSLPEFANDWYLSEAGVSSIINTIRSMMQSLWNRVQNFLGGQVFQLARKWVIDNEEKLRNLQYPDTAKIDILPYKDNITLPPGFRNLPNGLKNFNEKAVQNNDELQKFLKTLYPSEEIAKWFADDAGGKISAQKYMNLILFDEGSEQPKTVVSLAAADIPKKMEIWIKTIKDAEVTRAGFKQTNDEIQNAIGSINSKLVNISNQGAAPAQQAADRASTDASQAAKVDAQNNKQSQQMPENKAALAVEVSNKINMAINRLWVPLTPMIIRAMMNQYGYIKTAYNLGQPKQGESTASVSQKGQL